MMSLIGGSGGRVLGTPHACRHGCPIGYRGIIPAFAVGRVGKKVARRAWVVLCQLKFAEKIRAKLAYKIKEERKG